MGLEKDLSIPVRNVSKACAIIHLQMTQEPTRRYRHFFFEETFINTQISS